MGRNKYPDKTVALILDTAQALFLEKGYEHTTVQDIIDNLGGLTKGAIYHHFRSKEEILNAVTERIFENNSLSANWESIIVCENLVGAEKLIAMLQAALCDEQERKFRSMGINLKNIPQLLGDLLVRSVEEIAPKAIQPVLEQGMRDGSLKVKDPSQTAQVIALLLNVWLNPLVFSTGGEELERKCRTVSDILVGMGVDVGDLYGVFSDMSEG